MQVARGGSPPLGCSLPVVPAWQKPPQNWSASRAHRQTSFGRAKLTSFQATQPATRSDITNWTAKYLRG
jgi:hypothetical protein